MSRNPHEGDDWSVSATDSINEKQIAAAEDQASGDEIDPDKLMEQVFVCTEALEVRAMESRTTGIHRIRETNNPSF